MKRLAIAASLALGIASFLCTSAAAQGSRREFPRLAAKGFRVSMSTDSQAEWEERVGRDSGLCRTRVEIQALAREIFARSAQTPQGARDDCAEEEYARFFEACRNPDLTDADMAAIEADLDAALVDLEQSYETPEGHFILRWTEVAEEESHNVPDVAVVIETGGYLETAWSKYLEVFGVAPYVPAGQKKIEVIFHDIADPTSGATASPPDGPIQFDAPSWLASPGARKPTSAHELFHKLQYAFGYQTKPGAQNGKWFSEGTAAWAEVFVWGTVSKSSKVTELFSAPDTSLVPGSSYAALPFWIFFQARLSSQPGVNPMVVFLQKYQATGKTVDSAAQTVSEYGQPGSAYYADLAGFFALFSRERLVGKWKTMPDGTPLYGPILNVSGQAIVPKLKIEASIATEGGTPVEIAGTVSAFGADYVEITSVGQVEIAIDGEAGGDFSYLVIQKNKKATNRSSLWGNAFYPSWVVEDHTFASTVKPGVSILLIVMGREKGGAYKVSVKKK